MYEATLKIAKDVLKKLFVQMETSLDVVLLCANGKSEAVIAHRLALS